MTTVLQRGRAFKVRGLVYSALLAATAIGLAVWWEVAGVEEVYTLGAGDVIVFAVAGAMGHRLALPRDHGRATTMVVAVVAAIALLAQHPVLGAIAATTGWLADAVVARSRGHYPRIGGLVTAILTSVGVAAVGGLAQHYAPTEWPIGNSQTSIWSAAAVWSVLLWVSPALEALEISFRSERTRRLRYTDLARAGFQSNAVLAATGTLGALAYPVLHAFTVVLMALPLLAAKLGFDRNSDIRTTYDQTLRAMSRLPEQLGAVDPGHGVRVGEVAATAAVELGFAFGDVTEVERAGHLHELGRIRAEHGHELGPDEVATAGATIVREAGELDGVADMIEAHRGAVSIGNDRAWIGGALIRLACDLDLRVQAGDGRIREEDETWLRGQGVEARVAEALIQAARIHQPDLVA